MFCTIAALICGVREDFNAPVTAPQTAVETISAEKVPMSIRELQTFLNEAGHSRYKCDVDGKMGPKTLKAWSNYICDRQAIKEFK